MANTLEYIENYFSGNLSEGEMAGFENKCETDPEFAEEVGFYIAVRDNIRKELNSEKKGAFDELYSELSSTREQTPRTGKPSSVLKKLTPYFTIAAACLLLIVGWMVFFTDPSPNQLASNYIEENFKLLSIPMDNSQDSLQLGIGAFNQEDYSTAEKIFQALTNEDNFAPEAIKNLGILYLITEEYDKAIQEFDALSAYTDLHANSGPFYKAVALMKRDEGDDQEEAKKILQKIKEQQLQGSKEAKQWLEHF